MSMNPKSYGVRSALLIVGIMCVLFGVGSMIVGFEVRAFNLLSLTVGLSLLIFFAGTFMKKDKADPQKISIKKPGKFFLIRMYFLCALLWLSLNFFFSQNQFRLDLTKYKQHTLSGATVSFLEKLNENVVITVFYVGIPPKYIEDRLREYEHASPGRIKTEIVDPLVDLSYAARFGTVINNKEQKLIVRSQKETSEADFTDQTLTENLLNNAILRATRAQRHIYFLTGHGESGINDDGETGISTFKKHLAANNMVSHTLMLGTAKKIPADCDLLVIAGAKKPLTSDEDRMIKDYLERGGEALILVENTVVSTPDRPLTEEDKDLNPSMNEILNEWGANVGKDVVVDLASHISGDVGCPATNNYLTHRAIVSGLDYTFYIRPRSITSTGKQRSTIRVAPLVLTSSQNSSWGETNRYLQVKFDDFLDVKGPVAIAYVIWEPKSPAAEGQTAPPPVKKDSDTKIIVFTDADFLSNNYIGQYSNAQMGLNSVKWLTESDYQMFTDDREIKIENAILTSQQKRFLLVVLVDIPIVILLVGALTWLRQKK